ncbi:MAG: phosphoribosylformylglycinamidine synthase subunit PurQ [Planctomycetota bacterium]
MPDALVIRTAGTNCDEELCRAFELAGATVRTLHLDRLVRDPSPLTDADLVGLPGGFSYGDDIASGRVFAARARAALYRPLADAVDRGGCIIGVCNGFQVLVQCGLLPGPVEGGAWPEDPAPAEMSLAENQSARFVDRWAAIDPVLGSKCVWTRGLEPDDELLRFPSAHGEGRLTGPRELLDRLEQQGQVALRYADNFNGSDRAIAGVCDATGRVLGLMPHPERYLDWNRHPWASRLAAEQRAGDTPGLRLFRNAVEAVSPSAV